MNQVRKRLGRGLALFLAVLQVMLVFAVVPVSAADAPVASGNCGMDGNGDNLTWTLDSEGTLTISGTGAMESYESNEVPWDSSAVKTVVIEEGVTTIGHHAFYGCSSLISVAIPESVTYIGSCAFKDCTGLTSVTIPERVTEIEDTAFSGCTSLESVTIPDSVTRLAYSAFAGCTQLKEVKLPAKLATITETTFSNCSNLTSVTIPESVTSIEESAFNGCSALRNVTYAGTKEQWGEIEIAKGNDSLTSATITFEGDIYMLSGEIDDFGYFTYSNGRKVNKYEVTAQKGDNVWFCVYADNGYVLKTLSIDDTTIQPAVGETRYANYYMMGAADATITAEFEPARTDGFTIEISESGNGTISVEDNVVKAGEPVAVTVKPNAGYRLAMLTYIYEVKGEPTADVINADDDGAYTFTMPSRNVNLAATFEIDQEFDFDVWENSPTVTISEDVEGVTAAEMANAQVTGIGGTVNVNQILEKSGLDSTPEMNLYAAITVTGADLEAQTVSFEVKPVATVVDESSASRKNVEISNDMLNGNPITVMLPIPGAMDVPEEIVHISDDGTEEYYTLDGANRFTIETLASGQKVAVLQVTHFSTFEMKVIAHTHDTELKSAKEATCTKDGYTGDNVCKVCGYTEKGQTIPKLGHKTEVKNAKEATCTEAGYTGDEVCKTCGKTIEKGQTIEKLGHKTEVKNAKEATCTEVGYTGDEVCKTCGETVETGKAIPAKGHSWDNGKVTQEPTLTKEGVKTYTCTACDETKTESIEKLTECDGGEDCPTHDYKDVKSTEWYHLDVDYVVESGLMVGLDTGVFRPDENLTRAQMVQILYNWAGKPEVTGSSKFSDVADSAWYAKPIIWATEKGIVNGVGDGKFAPNDPVTREQLAKMLYFYAGQPEVSNELTDFADTAKITEYAVNPIKWAVEQDILRGDGSPRKLRPTDSAKRREVAAMLHRYIG